MLPQSFKRKMLYVASNSFTIILILLFTITFVLDKKNERDATQISQEVFHLNTTYVQASLTAKF